MTLNRSSGSRPSRGAIRFLLPALALVISGCAAFAGRPPAGATQALDAEQTAAIERIRKRVAGRIVWSSSRIGNHDLFLMNTDGSDVRQLTKGEHVDWFPRFSADGSHVLFTRSRKGWVSEKDANRDGKWDLFVMKIGDPAEPKKVADNASWGTWIGADEVLMARGTKVLTKNLTSGKETLLVDSTTAGDLGGAELQNPHYSPDRKRLTLTLRGAKRMTGIFHLEQKKWIPTGQGCQVNWFPSGDRIIWINPSGNGGSEVFSVAVGDGGPEREFTYEEMRFIDIPGRRSHEYFPQLDRTGKWLVWAATRRGHDHDIADYEIYIWPVGAAPEEATRLTFHSGNDRWPDMFIPASK